MSEELVNRWKTELIAGGFQPKRFSFIVKKVRRVLWPLIRPFLFYILEQMGVLLERIERQFDRLQDDVRSLSHSSDEFRRIQGERSQLRTDVAAAVNRQIAAEAEIRQASERLTMIEERQVAICTETREIAEQVAAVAERQTAIDTETRKIAERVAAIAEGQLQRVEGERDDALQALTELRANVARWRDALRPFPEYQHELPEWTLPPGPHVAASPQRYVDNLPRYLDRGGGMRPEDIGGFLDGKPDYIFDRTRFFLLSLVGDQIVKDGLAGDVAELGVHIGATASVLSLIAARQGKTIYLLDTFEGFPKQDLVDDDAIFEVQFGDTSLEAVRRRVPGDHVRFIVGYFPDSAVQIPDSATFCLVHLDCDLRKPLESGLRYFWPRLIPGGFLIIHDYGSLYWAGLEKAVDTFFADRPESIVPIPDACGTIVARKGK